MHAEVYCGEIVPRANRPTGLHVDYPFQLIQQK